jgi:hypothetical protein
VQLGGPNWDVKVGRRDSTTASFNGANNNILPPTSGLADLMSLFAAQGLSQKDMDAFSGNNSNHLHSLQTYIYRIPNYHLAKISEKIHSLIYALNSCIWQEC